MSEIKFSVLIPSIFERLAMAKKLHKRLEKLHGGREDIEVLMFTDNKKRSIGKKREDLVGLARGKYLAFVDDDDNVSDKYFESIMQVIDRGGDNDLIIINTTASIEGKEFKVNVGLNFPNEQVKGDGKGGFKDIRRKPFHVCVWKSDLAKTEGFPDKNYSEDWEWCEKLLPKVKYHVKIDEYLHKYHYSKEISQATIENGK